MRTKISVLGTMMVITHFSLSMAADPDLRQMPTRSLSPQQGGNISRLQLTPDFLYKQIAALQQQVAVLQAQMNAVRSVIQVTDNGTTIQAEKLTIHGLNNLTLNSSKKIILSANDDLDLESGKILTLQGGQQVTIEGAGFIKLKAPQIKLNDGTKPVSLVGSTVTGGKVVTGSTGVFAK